MKPIIKGFIIGWIALIVIKYFVIGPDRWNKLLKPLHEWTNEYFKRDN